MPPRTPHLTAAIRLLNHGREATLAAYNLLRDAPAEGLPTHTAEQLQEHTQNLAHTQQTLINEITHHVNHLHHQDNT